MLRRQKVHRNWTQVARKEPATDEEPRKPEEDSDASDYEDDDELLGTFLRSVRMKVLL